MDFLKKLEHHILDHALWTVPVAGAEVAVTKHMMLMWIVALVLIAVLAPLVRSWPSVPSGFRNFVEVFVVFMRDQVVLPNAGKDGLPYLPYFLTLFFFILGMNLAGLVPGSAAATGNIAVTGGLALCSFGLINYAGVRKFGFAHHVHNFIPHGVPWWLSPLMLPLELAGLATRSFALAIRLFANMVAGHIVMTAFVALAFLIGMIAVSVGTVPIAVAVGVLKVFVAFLQAFIFTFLTAIFVGGALHPH